jgi:hypothetical protein
VTAFCQSWIWGGSDQSHAHSSTNLFIVPPSVKALEAGLIFKIQRRFHGVLMMFQETYVARISDVAESTIMIFVTVCLF